MTLFVTVGSTRFDSLIDQILTDALAEQLVEFGFVKLTLQVGKSVYDPQRVEVLREEYNLEVEIYDYKSSITEDIEKSDVVIAHAGAGTSLEVLQTNKRLLIVVNDTLMDNHQQELADQLCEDKYAVQSQVHNLSKNLYLICDTKLTKFELRDPSKFESIFNEALRKVTTTTTNH